jgi:hypothetical protein
VLQGGVPLPVCVVEGRPSTCLCCRRVSSCLSVLLGCVPLPVRGPPELQSGMFLFWVLHSFFTPFLSPPGIVWALSKPLPLIIFMVFQLSLLPCKFSLCIFFSFLVLPWSTQLPTHPRISSHGLHHLYQLSVAQDPSAHPRDSLLLPTPEFLGIKPSILIRHGRSFWRWIEHQKRVNLSPQAPSLVPWKAPNHSVNFRSFHFLFCLYLTHFLTNSLNCWII